MSFPFLQAFLEARLRVGGIETIILGYSESMKLAVGNND